MSNYLNNTCKLVESYVSKNYVKIEDLLILIENVHAALVALRVASVYAAAAIQPAASEIAASIGQEYLISFIDGKSYKSLKRHLTTHGFTVAGYRNHYSLPDNYPMISPGYSLARSRIAREIHSGTKAS